MKKSICLLAICVFLCGCPAQQIGHMLDKFGDFAERMEKIQAEKNAALKAENYEIEGEIISCETIKKEIPIPSREVSEDGKSVKIETKYITKKFFVINFEDGREKEFTNIPSKPLNVGSYYTIKYNGLGEIKEVILEKLNQN